MSQSLKVNESFSHVSPSQYISVVVQWLSLVWLFVAPGTAACQAFLSFTISWSLLKLMSIESVMPSNHLILCHPLLLLPSIFPSIRIFSNESTPHIRWPKYWSFSFSISPSNGNSGLIYYISIHIYTYVCRIYICIFIYSVYLENTDQYTFSPSIPQICIQLEFYLIESIHDLGRRKWEPTPVFSPGESQGRGSLVGCHLWGCTESDTTEAT